jgi:hypothetical protein
VSASHTERLSSHSMRISAANDESIDLNHDISSSPSQKVSPSIGWPKPRFASGNVNRARTSSSAQKARTSVFERLLTEGPRRVKACIGGAVGLVLVNSCSCPIREQLHGPTVTAVIVEEI